MQGRALVGTAGHVDHGKTRLVEALTGIDCDRWEEEKRRGITIDLGFAHLFEDDLEIGFVDVPGHQRFLHNALAGLGGIRVLMLVVAADEGVMPQTREHVAICSLLEIPAALVVLTKADLVDAEVLELVQAEVRELLEGTPFAAAPVVAASGVTGEGVPEVRRVLLDLARRHASGPDDRPTRLPVDRAFQLKGRGLIVTGTLAHGSLAPGLDLEVMPHRAAGRLRGLQVHGRKRERAAAGERTAIQLAGVDAALVERGVELVEPGAWLATTRVVGRLTQIADAAEPLDRSTAIRLHLYAAAIEGKMRPLAGPIRPGETSPVEIRLVRPLVAARGDRFIVRRLTPAATLGGGRILDPHWRRRRRADLPAALEALGGSDEEAIGLWIRDAGEAGIEIREITGRLGLAATAARDLLEKIVRSGDALRLPAGPGHGERWVEPRAPRRIARRATEVLERFFAEHRLSEGMPRAEAVSRILPGRAAELADVYLPWLEREGRVQVAGGEVRLPGRGARLDADEESLAGRLVRRYQAAALAPPAPAALAVELASKPQVVEGVVKFLIDQGSLTRLPGGLVIATSALETLETSLRASGWERFSVPQFKERFGLSRKWAIPLLESLDGRNVTRRIGDERILLPPR